MLPWRKSVSAKLGGSASREFRSARLPNARAGIETEVTCGLRPMSSGHAKILDKAGDRKSTRLNSSHGYISYAVFCLKKKKKSKTHSQGVKRRETARLSDRGI